MENEKEQLIVKTKVSFTLRLWGSLFCLFAWLALVALVIFGVLLISGDTEILPVLCCAGLFIVFMSSGQILKGISKMTFEAECNIALLEEEREIKKC